MSEEYSPLSFPPHVDGGAGKPYAPLGAPCPPRLDVMSVNFSHAPACVSPSQPSGAPRTPRTSLSSNSLGHASVSTHALIPGSPPVSLLQSDACPPTATFAREPCTPNPSPPTCPRPSNPHVEADANRILPCDSPTLLFATWNANGLLTAEGMPEARRKVKKKALNKLLHDNDVVAVQETHGQSEQWSTTRKRLVKSHKVFHSHDPDSRNKAGVALFIKRRLSQQAFREEVVEVNPGRTLTVRLFFTKGCLSLTSIHNFEMNEAAQRQTAKHCADENRNAQNDEQGSSIHLIGGDFNFLARGEIPTRVSTKEIEIPLKFNDTRATNQSNVKWGAMMANSMEHHQPNKTRIGHNPNANESPDTHYLIAKRIDRIYSSILPWQAINLKIKSYTTIDVTKAETQLGSDHAPVATRISIKRQIPRDQRPIPHWLAKHPIFAETLQNSLENDKHELIEDPFCRIEAIKQAMRRASKKALRKILCKDPHSPESQLQFVLQAARAVAFNDTKMARTLIKSPALIGKLIEINPEGVVIMTCPRLFHECASKIANAQIERQINENEHGASPPKGGRAAQLRRLLRLWSPFDRKAVNLAIIKRDGTTTKDSDEAATALSDSWSKVFAPKRINLEKAHQFAKANITPMHLAEAKLPKQSTMLSFLKRAKASAPGPDGIPYAAWLASGSFGTAALYLAMRMMMDGGKPPPGFNNSIGIFLPKGTADDDTLASVKRTAENTRPLGLKNTDNKTIAAAINLTMSDAIAQWADTQQNGFIRGRQGLNNIIDIDARARILDISATASAACLPPPRTSRRTATVPSTQPVKELPAIILFDFCAAFPSVAHELIMIICGAMGLPEGLLNYIRSLYEDNVCIYRGCASDRTLYKIESGIIQGCPLSGSIFVLTVDPFLKLLKKTIPSATNRAFADDIATLVQSLQDLPCLKKSFDLFRDISGLALKVQKCSLIPLGINPTPDAIKRVTRAVRKITPDWANFSVVPSAEYLGVMIGPKGGSSASWEKPLKKYVERANLIANAALAPSIGTDLYSQRVVPTMSYIAQIACTTPKVLNAEKWALQRITHIPHNAFPRNTFFYQHEIGMRNITPLGICARAALIRTAKITCTWRHEWSELQKTRNEKGPMTNLAIRTDLPGKDNSWWIEPAYADNLSEACKSVPNNTWRTILKCSTKRTKSTQSTISKWLRKTTLTNNLANTIGPRISRFFPNANKTPASRSTLHDQLRKTINITKTATPAVATSVLRTWCNAWITARRTQSQIGRCRFGCTQANHRDELEHYVNCNSLIAPINGLILQKTGLILGSTPGEFLTLCPPHTRDAESLNPRANGTLHDAKRAARIIRLHIANDVYQSLGNHFSADHSDSNVNICPPELIRAKITESSRKLSENLNWVVWVTRWNSSSPPPPCSPSLPSPPLPLSFRSNFGSEARPRKIARISAACCPAAATGHDAMAQHDKAEEVDIKMSPEDHTQNSNTAEAEEATKSQPIEVKKEDT